MPYFNGKRWIGVGLRPLMLSAGKYCRAFIGAAKPELAHVTLGTAISITSTTSNVLTTPNIWFDGITSARVEVYFSNLRETNYCRFLTRMDGAAIRHEAQFSYGDVTAPMYSCGYVRPSKGFHSFDVSVIAASGSVYVNTSGYAPSFLRVSADAGAPTTYP